MLIGVSSLILICFPFQLAISLFTSQSHLGRVAINESRPVDRTGSRGQFHRSATLLPNSASQLVTNSTMQMKPPVVARMSLLTVLVVRK